MFKSEPPPTLTTNHCTGLDNVCVWMFYRDVEAWNEHNEKRLETRLRTESITMFTH